MSLGLIGGCCGPCVGDPPDPNGDDWVYPRSGLVANEAEGKFTIPIGRFPPFDPFGGPPPPSYGQDPITVGYSVTYYNECGCNHMIGRVSGTLSWAAGDTADKVVEIPLLAHGPPMFWTCQGVPPGGENASFDLSYISQNVWLPNGGHYDIVAICNHAAQNGNGQSWVAWPFITYYGGRATTPQYRAFNNQPPAYKLWTEEHRSPVGDVLYRRILGVDAGLTHLFERRSGDPNTFQVVGSFETINSPTVLEYQDVFGRKRNITLSDPQITDPIAEADQNLARARSEFVDVGGSYTTGWNNGQERIYDYPDEPPWYYSEVIRQPVPMPYKGTNGFYEHACFRSTNNPVPPPNNPLNTITKTAVKVDARGCLLNSSIPVRIELFITTHQFTNLDQTEWIDESNTGWFDITDTEYWIEPPPFFGFKTIGIRVVPPSPPPLPYYCHPGYAP